MNAIAARAVVPLAVGACVLACDGDVASLGAQIDAIQTPTCAPACGATAAACGVDYCASLPRLAAPPTIDGVLECGLPLAAIDPSHWFGPDPKPSDLSAEYAAAWTDAGVYLFVHVREAQRLPAPAPAGGKVYCGDAAHVFVDDDGRFDAPPAYDTRGTRQLAAEAPPSDATSAAVGTVYATDPSAPGTGAWNAAGFRTFAVADGYVLEALVTGDDLGAGPIRLAAGGRVGFDVSVSYGGLPSEYADDPTCAKRGDFVLRADPAPSSASGLPHDDVAAFCTPTLAAP